MRIKLDRLSIRVAAGPAQEHRLRGITRRALELLGEQVRARPLSGNHRAAGFERLTAPPLALDLRRMPDETVALQLAGALYGALRSRGENQFSTGRAGREI